MERKLKGVEEILILVVMALALIAIICLHDTHWSKCVVVDSRDGIVTIVDKGGDHWVFTDSESEFDTVYEIGDVVEVQWYEAGTRDKYDDEIVNVKLLSK